MIRLSLNRRIIEALQLDDADMLASYEMTSVKTNGSRQYFDAPADSWQRVVESLTYFARHRLESIYTSDVANLTQRLTKEVQL